MIGYNIIKQINSNEKDINVNDGKSSSSLVELGDYFIMNRNVVAKNGFYCTDQKSLNIYCSNSSMILKETQYNTNNTSNIINSYKFTNLMEEDINNPDIIYVIGNSYNSDTPIGNGLYKLIKSETGEYSKSGICQFYSNSNYAAGDIISQDDMYIYLKVGISYTTSSSYFNSYIYKIDKLSMTINKSITLPSSAMIHKISEDDFNIYLYTTGLVNCAFYKYNKIDSTFSLLYNETDANLTFQSQPTDEYNNFIYKFSANSKNNTSNYYKYNLLSDVPDSKKIIRSDIDIIYPSEYRNFTYYTLSKSANVLSLRSLIWYSYDSDGTKYANHTFYVENSTEAKLFNIMDSIILTYKIINENTWEYIGYTQLDIVPSYIINKNNAKILICSNNRFLYVYVWSNSEHKYIKNDEISFNCDINSIGKTVEEDIYVQLSDNQISEVDIKYSLEAISYLEEENYEYNGIDIYTNIHTKMQDIDNNLYSVKLIVKLIGNMIFEDGTKQKQITTSEDNEIITPVIIKGTGYLSIENEIVIEVV